MKQPQFIINDYAVYNQKVVRVTGIAVADSNNGKEISVIYTVTWLERDSEGWGRRYDFVEATSLHSLDATQKILLKIGFKVVGFDKYNYCDFVTRKVAVIERADDSMYVYKHGEYRLLDFVYADFVSDIQHAFASTEIDFPNLDLYFAEHAKDYEKEKYLE